ncbi:carboxy-S-adenosyl-L-methionine synthase CmoA [Agaribacter marinus]|uniref:Carboxy-S-adenosyl-L-methionine synthase n=1 Tax=Agaribacter marinus TaxID=1431249 RepID=A0AA37SV97_9ALTE|nr:carboxy-S-adenosyl-L-methionine synthase CmoA [Agaribacter marinus]GLR69942.1 carboxy-S-adenosyl-L-methionine synthase [Agaribacter marinus]
MKNTPSDSGEDKIFASPQSEVAPFSFNESVVDVFPDMINRSVPGYGEIISSIPKILRHYIDSDTLIYDLGCSLGATSLSIARTFPTLPITIKAIDYSDAMVERCKQRIGAYNYQAKIDIKQGDICLVELAQCNVVIINFTLQFISRDKRQALLSKIYDALKPGGIFILSEKISDEDALMRERLIELHHDFKRDNGYSELEISQKRSALENVMVIDSLSMHKRRLREAGFKHQSVWFQHFNFVSMMAIK